MINGNIVVSKNERLKTSRLYGFNHFDAELILKNLYEILRGEKMA